MATAGIRLTSSYRQQASRRNNYRFTIAVQQLIEETTPDLLIIETTGPADPNPIVDAKEMLRLTPGALPYMLNFTCGRFDFPTSCPSACALVTQTGRLYRQRPPYLSG